MTRRRVAALALASLLAGCSALDWFGPDRPKPKALEPIAAPQTVARVAWSARLPDVRFPLVVATAGGAFTVAAGDGTVVAFAPDTGRELWRTNVGGALSAGVGSDGRVAAVVTRSGELVAIEGGAPRWRKPVGTRIASAPLVAGARVFLLGVDRSVQAYDAQDGTKLWQVNRPGDPLTLQQDGVIAAFRNTLVVGQGPRLAGLDPANGSVRWEVPIGAPRGTNELERLADLIGPLLRVDTTLCARSFQAAVGCVNGERGALLWTKNVGGTDAVGGDAQAIYGADASDRITAWKLADGNVQWTSDALLNHGLGAPVVMGDAVAFAAADGMVHFLSRAKGEALQRLPTDGSPPAAPPASLDGTVLFVTRSGGLYALRAP